MMKRFKNASDATGSHKLGAMTKERYDFSEDEKANMTRDEFIFKKVWPGKCWHRGSMFKRPDGSRVYGCSICGSAKPNPDFSTWPGFGMLLEGMREHERWEEFCITVLHNVPPHALKLLSLNVKIRMLEEIPFKYINPPAFADAVAEFFGGEG